MGYQWAIINKHQQPSTIITYSQDMIELTVCSSKCHPGCHFMGRVTLVHFVVHVALCLQNGLGTSFPAYKL